ncbi:MAG: DNA-binding protein [Chthoniobacterales bacterium]
MTCGQACVEFASQRQGDPDTLDDVPKEMDNIIEAREIQIERKHFHVEFRENDRGKFLRITEEAHGRRNTIIVPGTGVDDFTSAIGEVLSPAERAQSV